MTVRESKELGRYGTKKVMPKVTDEGTLGHHAMLFIC